MLIKTIKVCTALGTGLVDEFGLLDIAELLDTLTEVALVEFGIEDGLIQTLKLREREEGRQQAEGDRLGGDFLLHEFQGLLHHDVVVGEKHGDGVDADPLQTILAAEVVVVVLGVDEHIVGHGHHTLARVAVDLSEGTYLTHVEGLQSREFVEHTVGGIVHVLVGGDEASIEAPFAASRVDLTTADENLQFTLVEAEDDTVDCYQYLCVVFIECHCLPEVSIETSTEADDQEGAYDIPDTPAFTDALLEVGREGDGIDLSL